MRMISSHGDVFTQILTRITQSTVTVHNPAAFTVSGAAPGLTAHIKHLLLLEKPSFLQIYTPILSAFDSAAVCGYLLGGHLTETLIMTLITLVTCEVS